MEISMTVALAAMAKLEEPVALAEMGPQGQMDQELTTETQVVVAPKGQQGQLELALLGGR
jgi:hypothetical protein